MVNAPDTDQASDRRERARPAASHATVLGASQRNPFGDLHTLQHLSARLARGLRGVFEPLLRQEVRAWAEPVAIERLADYRAGRPDRLTAWLPMAITPGAGRALAVLDGRFVLELLDLFFGGLGTAPSDISAEFSPAGEALVARIGAMLAAPLAAGWEPVARLAFAPGRVETNPALVAGLDAEDLMVVTRFGLAPAERKPVTLDLLYPVAALKPHAPSLTGKVVAREATPDPVWRQALTRAVMGVRFPVRSVLAEPVVRLSTLMALKPGDVIPISVNAQAPVMVGRDRLGVGEVGASNGRAAVRLTQITRSPETFQ